MNIEYKPLTLVILTLIIGVVSAAILDTLANTNSLSLIAFIKGILLVLCVNVSRLVLWNYIHKHYPLSKSYPMTALFFPLILGLAVYKGDATTVAQFVGVAFITLGVYQLSKVERGSA